MARLSREWVWRWFNLVLTMFVALGVYTLKVDRRKDILEAITEYDKIAAERYLTRRDFDIYKLAHMEWSQEVIRRLESEVAGIRVLSESNNKMLFELHAKLMSKSLGQAK